MPSSTSSSSTKSIIKSRGIKKIEKRLTATQYVRKYTEMLVLGVRRTYALERLVDAECPIRAFEENLTEKVLEKHIAPLGMYTFHLNKLAQKFDKIRRKDLINAQRKVAESRECNAYIENQKMILEQKTQAEIQDFNLFNSNIIIFFIVFFSNVAMIQFTFFFIQVSLFISYLSF
ncbi:Protein CBG10027 [Caenorhabditis briggsae]|uniref:Protein CBG10027 n=1 Tax=Caenorhabditis briggsae TaxID=6238 RepID=A8XA76_CAEBR|nr:Protein CBG10027 [Caenorhabditis briggsae]CAP29544.2 Protein CBG10027 [Caenorhabditis briggsae]